MTVTSMATPRGPIRVTVDTFGASGWPDGGGYHGGGGGVVGTRSADAYIGFVSVESCTSKPTARKPKTQNLKP